MDMNRSTMTSVDDARTSVPDWERNETTLGHTMTEGASNGTMKSPGISSHAALPGSIQYSRE
jgi:hypothetical protein